MAQTLSSGVAGSSSLISALSSAGASVGMAVHARWCDLKYFYYIFVNGHLCESYTMFSFYKSEKGSSFILLILRGVMDFDQ